MPVRAMDGLVSDWGEKGSWRIILAAAGVSALLGVLATLLGVGYYRQSALREVARQESARAREAATRARDAANRGARARDEAEDLLGFLLDDLRDGLEEIDRSDLLEAAAAKAVAYFDNLPPELITPESKAKQASILTTLAQARYVQGNHEGAVAAMRRGLRLRRERIAAGDADGEQTFVLGRELSELGLFQNQAGDHGAARESYLEALRLFENPPPGADRDGHWEYGLATAHLGLGEVERLQKNYPGALSAYSNTIAHVTAALAKQPGKVNWLKKLMNARNNSGVVRMYLDDVEGAERSYLLALETARSLVRLEPQNRRWEKELATTLLNVGTCLEQRRQYARAEPLVREALGLRQGLAAWDYKNARAQRELAHAWHDLSSLQFRTGQNVPALSSARQALSAFRRLLTLEPGRRDWIEDMRRSAEKYRDRLLKAGMKDEALELIKETTAFAEANRAGQAGADAWDQLLAGFYDDLKRLGGRPDTTAILEVRRKALEERASLLTEKADDPESICRWALACIDFGRVQGDAGLAASALSCIRLGRWVLRDRLPTGFRHRKLFLDQAERLDVELALQLGRLSAPKALVPAGAVWRYWDHREEPGPDWKSPAFDDSAWPEGKAPLGYGDNDMATFIGYGGNERDKNLTAWFRHGFTLDDPSAVHRLRFSLRRDDGAVVYLNGVEVFRDGIAAGPVTPATVARMAKDEEEVIYHITNVDAAPLPLVKGRNVFAVEVHQNEPPSSDLCLDLEVLADFTAPDPATGLDMAALKKTLGPALPEAIEKSWPGPSVSAGPSLK